MINYPKILSDIKYSVAKFCHSSLYRTSSKENAYCDRFDDYA